MSRTADIDTSGLRRCIGTLEVAFAHLQRETPDEAMRDIFRAACVKQFELVLEIGGSLLRKRIREFFASSREAHRLTFRDAFRHAAKHGLVSAEACKRWLQYRDIRNASAHDYGERFAGTALELIPAFVADARALAGAIEGEDVETHGRDRGPALSPGRPIVVPDSIRDPALPAQPVEASTG